ncbi:MAG: serine hydrolase domain-containing protein, partial [Pseudomonadota bacterium]
MSRRALFVGLCLATAASLSACMTPLDEEALYLKRYERGEAARETRDFNSIYDTMAPLRAANPVIPLERGSLVESPLNQDIIDAAIAYAAPRNSEALLILHEGKLVSETYFGDTRDDTPLVAKSLAKPLSVIAVGRAIQLGYIASLDQPMSDFFTEWQGTPKQAILVRHLLDMRSGLKRQSRYSGPEDVMRKAYLHPRHDEIIIADYPLINPPGTRYEYANANAELVAPLIERATGSKYEDWVADQVLQPLGARGGEIWLNRPGGTAHAGCCSSLPAMSWVKLAQLVLSDGQWRGTSFLPSGFTDEMRTPTAQNPFVGMAVYNGATYAKYRGAQNPDTGTGTLHSEPYATPDVMLFDGNGNQVIYMIPSEQLIIARFGDTPAKDLGWDNAKLPNLL